MRQESINILSGADNLSLTGSAIDISQQVNLSVHTFFSDVTAAGTIKLQASNDPVGTGALRNQFTPSHWVDIPSATASITSGASALITVAPNAYSWLRAVYTMTGTGAQTVTTVADVAGSLNSKYFLLDSSSGGTKYYVWFNINSAGVDPAVAGRTGVEVDGATGITNDALATAIASAVDALTNFISTATGHVVTITNAASGPFVPAVNGNATGFTFAVTAGGGGTINCNMNAVGV